VWGAAGPWAAWSGDALLAHQRAELRLRQLHPAAMAHFDTQLKAGADEVAAMRAAALMFVTVPSDRAALAAQAAEALEDLSWAQRSRSEMDDRLTRADEQTLGTQDGARHQGLADAAAARASTPPDLAAEGYPLPNRPSARVAGPASAARTTHSAAVVRTR
jgi:hypothetical protein